MLNSSPDLPQNSLQIKQDDKFFSRLLSKESSNMASFRVLYYGGVSGAVPFLWESQPGTPKHPICDSSLPPLTPPPSYHSNYISKQQPTKKKKSRSKLFHTLLLRSINLKKAHFTSSPSSSSSLSSSSWSSSHSTMSVPMSPSNFHRRNRFSSQGSSFDDKLDDDQEKVSVVSPTSTLCFGGAYSIVIMRKALLAMVGRGSGKD